MLCLSSFVDVKVRHLLLSFQFCISMVGVVILSLTTILVPAPEHLPDLFPLVISLYSCAHFGMFMVYFHYAQFTSVQPVTMTKAIEKTESKINDKEQTKFKFAKKNKQKKKKQH